jgi:hypothetical protein
VIELSQSVDELDDVETVVIVVIDGADVDGVDGTVIVVGVDIDENIIA